MFKNNSSKHFFTNVMKCMYDISVSKNKNIISDDFKVIQVEHIKEVLEYALIDTDNYNTSMTYDKTFNFNKYFK